MLTPQFSLRRLLAWVTLSGFICLILAAAARGQAWAAGIVIGMLGIVLVLLTHGLVYLALKPLSAASGRRRAAAAEAAPDAGGGR